MHVRLTLRRRAPTIPLYPRLVCRYAISARLERRVKHYKVVVEKGLYSMEGIDGTHSTIHELIRFYSQHPLPSADSDEELIKFPLHLVHDLGLGIDHRDKLIKSGGASTVAEEEAAAIEEAGAPTDEPRLVDDTVFSSVVPLAPGRRWMRGTMTREAAEIELGNRGMANGRFLIRVKERSAKIVSLALSYAPLVLSSYPSTNQYHGCPTYRRAVLPLPSEEGDALVANTQTFGCTVPL